VSASQTQRRIFIRVTPNAKHHSLDHSAAAAGAGKESFFMTSGGGCNVM
jgi:hypothetical protein